MAALGEEDPTTGDSGDTVMHGGDASVEDVDAGDVPDPPVLMVHWVSDRRRRGGGARTGRLVYERDVSSLKLSGDVVRDQFEAPYPRPVLRLAHMPAEYWEDISLEYLAPGRIREHPRLSTVLMRAINDICPHAADMEQSPIDSSRGFNPHVCNEPDCDVAHNLWLCLHCGHVACGRIRYFSHLGDGGNGHALHHWKLHPSHNVCVKLGTIAADEGDCFCYDCEALVQDPRLHRHLYTYGVDRRLQQLTCPRVSQLLWASDAPPEDVPYNQLPVFTEGGGARGRVGAAVIAGLADQLFVHALRWVGDVQEVMRTLMLVSRGVHRQALRWLATLGVAVDLSGSPRAHAHTFFKWTELPRLAHLKWTKPRIPRCLAAPDYPVLTTVILQRAVLDKTALAFFMSLAWLPRLEVLGLQLCETATWDAVATAARRGVRFRTLRVLDLAESRIPPPQLDDLLSMGDPHKLEALRLGFAHTARTTAGEWLAATKQVLRVITQRAPALQFLEYICDPREGGDIADGEVAGLLHALGGLEVLLAGCAPGGAAFVAGLPDHFPHLRLVQLGGARVPADALAALLDRAPHLRICPKVRHALELRERGVPAARLVPPVAAQRTFDATYLRPPAAPDAPPAPQHVFTGTASCVL